LIGIKDAAGTEGTMGLYRGSRMRTAEQKILNLTSALLGVTFLLSSLLSADFAREHMASLGRLCGSRGAAHCGWCFAAVGFALLGLAAFAAAVQQGRSPAPAWRRA